LTDDINLYLSYNHGYRPGGSSIVPSPVVGLLPVAERNDLLLYDEETSDAFELGFKSRLMDGRATLNAAVYYQEFSDYLGFVRGLQVYPAPGYPVGNPEDLTGGIVFNGDATTWGVEVEGQILITETWSFGGAASFNNSEWDDGAESPCNVYQPGEQIGSCAIDGQNTGGEPEWSASLNSEFYIPIDALEWYVRGLYSFTGERDNTDASAGIGAVSSKFDEYSLFNLYTGIRSEDLSWDVTLWAKNVFDADEVVYQQSSDQYDIALSGGSYTQTNILKERTFGITGRYNF